MADIQTYLDYILSKTYGKEVRQAIVDAINQCYVDASAGVTPVITTSEITGGTRITITVGSIATNVDVMDGTATDEQVEEWLDNHPEATTSVADGSISTAKLADGAVTAAKLDPNINLGVADNAVTRPKIAEHAVNMDKTDFYYHGSVKFEADWLTFTTNTAGFKATVKVADADCAQAVEEFPNTLYIISARTQTATVNAGSCSFSGATSGGVTQTYAVEKEFYDLGRIDGKTYRVTVITKESFLAGYNNYLANAENLRYKYGFSYSPYNPITNTVEDIALTTVEPTTEMIEMDFVTTVMSDDFVTAVQAALNEDSSGTSSYEEELAKARLSGKVMICLGDSYTAQMSDQLTALATKYEMVCDNRGLESSQISGTGASRLPFYTRADTIVSDYTSGHAISGTTYTADDVGIITFMGGANDGFGVETWIGTGIHETDKTKIYGACNYIFNLLLKTFTKAKMIVITQPSNYNQTVSSITDDTTAQTLGFENLAELQQMDDYQFSNYAMANKEQAVKNTAWAYGIPTIDMFHDYPTILNPANRTAYYRDALHPNTGGYKLIVDALDKKIVEVVVR